MADLGLGNRTTLKSYLLTPGLGAATTSLWPDAVFDALGDGVAKQIEKYCNREFVRATGIVEEFPGDRLVQVLNRYPIEQVTQIQYRFTALDTWTTADLTTYLVGVRNKSGLVQFPALLGSEWSSYQVTYDGGYWYDTTEDGSGVKPAPATLLPNDLKLAWLKLCAMHWEHRDKLGLNVATDGKMSSGAMRVVLAQSEIGIPREISLLLDPHRRMQMS